MPAVHALDTRVMGCAARVLVADAEAPVARDAVAHLHDLEARWSRFRPDSELSRLNAAPGVPCLVSAETYLLVERACEAWRATSGSFDPTVHDALVALGYDRSFEHVAAAADVAVGAPQPARGCAGISCDPVVRAVRVPVGVRLDPGGIGKGLAADLVAVDALAAGASGVLVDVGGDLRVAGAPPDGEHWHITVDDPHDPGSTLAELTLTAGGIATSSRLTRRWVRAGEPVHHLVDPVTGLPAPGEAAAVTVVAAEAWVAEVLAKAVMLRPDGAPALLERFGARALVVDGSGDCTWLGPVEEAA